MTTEELNQSIDYKAKTARAMRDARKAELNALLRKAESDTRLAYTAELDRRAKA